MTRPSEHLFREIAALRAENEALRERVRWMEEAVRPVDEPFPRAWGLSPAQRRILALLLAAAPRAMTKHALCCASSPSGVAATGDKVAETHVAHINKRLSALVPGARILLLRGEGYFIAATHKALIAAALARAAAAGDPPALPQSLLPRAPQTPDATRARATGRADGSRRIRPAFFSDPPAPDCGGGLGRGRA